MEDESRRPNSEIENEQDSGSNPVTNTTETTETTSEQKPASRGRSTSRKRQLSTSSSNEMRPPATRPRSQSQSRDPKSDQIIFKTQGQVYNITNLVETALQKESTLQKIIPDIIVAVRKTIQKEMKEEIQEAVKVAVTEGITEAIRPLKNQIIEQDRKLITLFSKTHTLQQDKDDLTKQLQDKNDQIVQVERKQDELVETNRELIEQIKLLNDKVEDLEQYGRRTSLRFHNVPMKETDLQNTEKLVINIANDKLKVFPPLNIEDINRSHIIGEIKEGKGQIICRFRNWRVKNRVYGQKTLLKKNEDRIFVTEDLTRVRQTIIKKLAIRKKSKEIHSFWTNDGRIFVRKTMDSTKTLIKTLSDASLV